MIRLSEKERKKLPNSVKRNVAFANESITNNSFSKDQFDICIAMGVIGYFEEDGILFKEVFCVGFLNKLNNPITRRTITPHINKFFKFIFFYIALCYKISIILN